MKKALFRLLLFFVGSHATHAVASSTDTLSPPDVHTQEATISQEAAINHEVITDDDTYLVKDYPSLVVNLVKMDYLVNWGKGDAPLPVEKFSLGLLLRLPTMAFTYGIRINKSRFAICPGIGYSTLKYSFKGRKSGEETVFPALKRVKKDRTECADVDPAADLQVAEEEAKAKVSSSTFSVSYFDILLRLRFNSVLDEPKDGFYVWLGGKLGIRTDASACIKLSKYGETSVSEYTEHYNLRRYVFGAQAGIGYHRFGLTVGYSFNSLFEKKEGPEGTDLIRPLSISIQVDLL